MRARATGRCREPGRSDWATLPVQGRSVTYTRALQVESGPGSGLELGLDLDRSATGQAPRFWPLLLVAIGIGLLWLLGGKLVRREASNG